MNKIQIFIRKLLVQILLNSYSRKKWKKHLENNKYDSYDYRIDVEKVRDNIDFFNIYPYCPDLSSDFDKEKPFLEAALAFANYCYVYDGKIDVYKYNVEKIGSYFEAQLTGQGINNVKAGGIIQKNHFIQKFDIYIKYLHARATVAACLENNSAMAARLNNEAAILSRNKKNIDDFVVYKNCSMCNKIESLVLCDHNMIDSLMVGVKDIEEKLIGLNFDSKHRENLFENYMLRCKMQLYAIEDVEKDIDSKIVENIENYLMKAKSIIFSNDEYVGVDSSLNQMAIYLYSAFLSFFKGQIDEAKKNYDKALEKSDNAKIAYFCLIRIPEEHIVKLAGFLEKKPIHYSTKSIKRNDELNNNFRQRVLVWVGLILILYLGGVGSIYYMIDVNIVRLILGGIFLLVIYFLGKAIFHVYVERGYTSYLTDSNRNLSLKMIKSLRAATITLVGVSMTAFFSNMVTEWIK